MTSWYDTEKPAVKGNPEATAGDDRRALREARTSLRKRLWA